MLLESGAADFICVVVNVEGCRRVILKSNGTVIKGEYDGFIFIRRSEVQTVKGERVIVREAEDSILAVAFFIDKVICASIAPE